MRKARQDVDEDFPDVAYFGGDLDDMELGVAPAGTLPGGAERLRPARQRLELRDEQKSLREQLSDWDDYGEDFDTSL